MIHLCKFLLFIIIHCLLAVVYAKELTPQIQSPVTLKADSVKYDANINSISAQGNVYVTMDNYIMHADSLYYDLEKDVLFAQGNIRIKDETGKIIYGQRAILKDRLKKGIIDEFILNLPDGSIIVALYAQRHDTKKASLHKATFTPCKITCRNQPIWQIRAKDTDLDYDDQKITYRNMFFEVFGVPVAYIPYFFHPTPNAPAQSGILVPTIKDTNLLIPLYTRVKPNMDFTISPRLAKDYTIFEGQFRHLLKAGSYEINSSLGNPSFTKGQHTSRFKRYYVFAKGDFSKEDINYGFDINRVSDKAYLTNYYERFDSYLESRLYTNRIDTTDYFSLEAFTFQGLRTSDKKSESPLVFPRLRSQNVIGLNDNETVLLKVKNDTIGYNENYNKQLARNALELTLSADTITENGHLFHFALANRNDLYLLSSNDPVSEIPTEKTWTRNIPELHAKWNYPLIRNFANDIAIKLEPIVAAFLGINYSNRFKKFALADIANYELSEYNIFNSNRFSGIDYHDYGKRLSYGLNTSLFSDPYYFDFFLGQLFYQNNIAAKGNNEYVGDASIDIANNLKLYYRFRRDVKFNHIRDEIGLNTTSGKLTTGLGFSRLNNISKYYSDDLYKFPYNKVSQISANAGYQILDSLKLDLATMFDITKKTRLLQRTIMMTYVMDCVSINVKFYDDYVHDQSRGVRKTHTQTYAIGLKVLNM